MKKFCAFIFLGLASGCLPAQAPNQIIVDGEATLEFEPEVFALSATIRARSDTQLKALSEMSERLDGIRETLPGLEGLTHLDIDASEAEIEPVLDRQCVNEADYETEKQCPITSYFGSISLTIKGAPAEESGDALSMLSELGAESVSLSHYALLDKKAARKETLDAAVRDARENAENIAGASGSTVVGVERIQYGQGFGDAYGRDDQDTIIVTGTRFAGGALDSASPAVPLDLEPQKIEVRAKVVAAFEIE